MRNKKERIELVSRRTDANALEGECDSAPELTRRSLLKLMAASVALAAGVPGCQRKPERKILSIHSAPEYQQPGQVLQYASTFTDGTLPYGLLIKTVDGRPIKIEGNPAHPLNQGASSAPMQAAVLSLYDPDRLRAPRSNAGSLSWQEVDARVSQALDSAGAIAVLTRATLSPSELSLIALLKKRLPAMRHFVHETIHDRERRALWNEAFGLDGVLEPRLEQAAVVLSIDSDFLSTDGPVLASIRGFAASRNPERGRTDPGTMSRLYVAEGSLTLTGANADHRIRLRPSAAPAFVKALREAVDGRGRELTAFGREHRLDAQVLAGLVEDLATHPGEAVVLAGPHLPGSVHAQVLLLNHRLGALNGALAWNPAPASLPVSKPAQIEAALGAGVDVLVCLGVNPVYDWPGGGFERLLGKARLSIGHGLYDDETVSACTVALPSSHNLESWNDANPGPGLFSICQPVIHPLYASRQEAETLLAWAKMLDGGRSEWSAVSDWHDYMLLHWKQNVFPPGADVRKLWEETLRTGLFRKPSSAQAPALRAGVVERIADAAAMAPPELELVIHPDPAIHDGRFANNSWLQELPDPITKVVWDNVAALSAATARDLRVSEGDLILIKAGGKQVALPVHIQPGTADGVLAAAAGYGRTKAGRVGSGVGVNLAPLMDPAASNPLAVRVRASGTGRRYPVARVQKHDSMEGRAIVVEGTLTQYRKEPGFAAHRMHAPRAADLYESYDTAKGHQWAMVIDLGACIGCGACISACQAENNIPVVGKTECGKGREMHWIRVDRYFAGSQSDPEVLMQPMLCQHCERAPCENVCPVNATSHDAEGLNQMVYNRCIGTRYCSNNCPFKVRRFNFFDFQKRQLVDPVQELVFNPQVTVRSVGIMEKCTFCVQRINAARFQAQNEGRTMEADAVRTACQQACPARAIAFGDLNNPAGSAARLRKLQRAYGLLGELNLKPRVTYLARIRNLHPATLDPRKGGRG